MRPYFLLLSLILPHVIANHLQDQRNEPQDVSEEGYASQSGSETVAQKSASGRAGRKPLARSIVKREKELRADIESFPLLHHTDCHSGVAARMSDRCGAKSEAIMTEGQRSDVAISLTICSMSSALQPIPSECTLWTDSRVVPKARSSGRSWFWVSTEGEEDVKVSRAMCLSALHRSPQDWTAYNNYLSDAVQLCHALRSQHAEETAHQLYRNATQRQLELLDLIKTATETAESRDAVQADLTAAQLQESQEVMSSINELVRQLKQESTNADAAVNTVHSALMNFECSGAGIWRKVQDQAILQTEDILSQMKDGLQGVKEAHLVELATSIRDISLEHSLFMSLQTQRVNEELGLSLASAKSGVEAVMSDLAGRLRDNDMTLQQWGEMMLTAQHNLARLASDTEDLHPILRQSAEDALVIKKAQEVLASSMRESGTISESISRNLAVALSEINNTLSDVQIWRTHAVAQPWWRFQPGLSIFSSPALLSSPKLSSLISPNSLKAMAYTADLSLAWIAGLLYWFVSTIASILASLLVMVWICTSGLVASQMKRLWQAINAIYLSDTDVEHANPTKETPMTPRNRLQSLAPPAYASPQQTVLTDSILSNALALGLDTVDEMGGLDQVREAMIKRSYANLRQGRSRGRGLRAVSAPP